MMGDAELFVLDRGTRVEDWRITYRAALSRFTVAEWAGIELFSIFRPGDSEEVMHARAVVRASLARLAACMSTYVWLKDPEVLEGVAGFVALGLLDEERQAQILEAPPTPGERP